MRYSGGIICRYARLLVWLLLVPAGAALAADAPAVELQLSAHFPRRAAPGTGRRVVQLTTGAEACYPLYYFTPSISRDGRYLVYHRYENKTVQLWRLNLATAVSLPLTHATGTSTDWRPWQRETGLGGIMDYRSVLNVTRNQVIYFDRNQAHAVDLETGHDELLFELPPGREPIGQNTTTPDGTLLVYIDAAAGAENNGHPWPGTRLMAYNFDTRQQQTLCTVDNAIHHVLAYDNTHFIVNHPPHHDGIIWTDLTSGQWSELRWGDPGIRGHSCHQLPTARGIAYEAFGGGPCAIGGLYDPFTRRRFEFYLPAEFGYTHTGYDPDGRLWFWETTGKLGHSLWYLEQIDARTGGLFKPLIGNWTVAADKQRGHFHPQVTPDRHWIMLTGGDDQHHAQVFLLDIADLPDTTGITVALLSATGEHDCHIPGKAEGAPALSTAPPPLVVLGGAALAAASFTQAEQAYAGEHYRCVADGPISVVLPIAPQAGHKLQLRWGAKHDRRCGVLVINGQSVPLTDGDYDGFRWLTVPLPANLTGEKYLLELRAAEKGKAAFIAGVKVEWAS